MRRGRVVHPPGPSSVHTWPGSAPNLASLIDTVRSPSPSMREVRDSAEQRSSLPFADQSEHRASEPPGLLTGGRLAPTLVVADPHPRHCVVGIPRQGAGEVLPLSASVTLQ